MDYKEWIQTRAEERALEHFGMDYSELAELSQQWCYSQAEEDYKDYLAAQIDRAREEKKYGN